MNKKRKRSFISDNTKLPEVRLWGRNANKKKRLESVRAKSIFAKCISYLRAGRHIIVLLFFISLLYVIPRNVIINNIQCVNQFGVCSQTILSDLERLAGGNSVFVKNRINIILESSARVESFSVRFEFPNTYSISVVEKTATFSIHNTDYQTIALLSNDGEVLALVEESALPYLTMNDTVFEIGDIVDNDILQVISLADSLNRIYKDTVYSISDGSLVVNNINSYTVYFPLVGDKDVLIGSLALILSRLKQNEEEFRIKGRSVEEIDLRFKNPVLR